MALKLITARTSKRLE